MASARPASAGRRIFRANSDEELASSAQKVWNAIHEVASPYSPHVYENSGYPPGVVSPDDTDEEDSPEDELSRDRIDFAHGGVSWEDDMQLGRFEHLNYLMREGPLALPAFSNDFSARNFLHDQCAIAVIGCGGLGSEIVKNLVLMGFGNIHVVDMDVIRIHHYNRFRFPGGSPEEDLVGSPKVDVVANYVNSHYGHVRCVPHFCEMESLTETFFTRFNFVVSAVDSDSARRWISAMLVNVVEFDENGDVNPESIVTLIDCSSDGFSGHVRIVLPLFSGCLECVNNRKLGVKCVLDSLGKGNREVHCRECSCLDSPRTFDHCAEMMCRRYRADLAERSPGSSCGPTEADIERARKSITEKSIALAKSLGISLGEVDAGVVVDGIVKTVRPMIAATSSVVAAIATNEIFKIAMHRAPMVCDCVLVDGLSSKGERTVVKRVDRDPECRVCEAVFSQNLDVVEAVLEEAVKDMHLDPHRHSASQFSARSPLSARGAGFSSPFSTQDREKRVDVLLTASGNFADDERSQGSSPLVSPTSPPASLPGFHVIGSVHTNSIMATVKEEDEVEKSDGWGFLQVRDASNSDQSSMEIDLRTVDPTAPIDLKNFKVDFDQISRMYQTNAEARVRVSRDASVSAGDTTPVASVPDTAEPAEVVKNVAPAAVCGKEMAAEQDVMDDFFDSGPRRKKKKKKPKRRELEQASEEFQPVRLHYATSISLPSKSRLVDPSSVPASDVRLDSHIGDHYRFGKIFGTGASSVVRECFQLRTGKRFACKIINLKAVRDLGYDACVEQEGRFASEVEILRRVGRHPNIVSLEEVFETHDRMYLVMECVDGGELFARISEAGSYTEKDARLVFKQILSGVAYLHSRKIVHRDLKPENLLCLGYGDEMVVKISDFGLSKIVADNRPMDSICGSPFYLAPEVLNTEISSYGPEVDLWSLGVILYILLSGEPPFFDNEGTEMADGLSYVVLQQIQKADFSFDGRAWRKISQEAKDLISSLLVVDSKKRATITQTSNCPWMSGDLFEGKHLKGRPRTALANLEIPKKLHNRGGWSTHSSARSTTSSGPSLVQSGGLPTPKGVSAGLVFGEQFQGLGSPSAVVAVSQSPATFFETHYKNLLLDSEKLKIDKLLDKGSFAEVFLGEYDGIQVAVKKLYGFKGIDDEMKEVLREIDMLKGLSHANILRLLGVSLHPAPFAICTEYCHLGSLYDHLHLRKERVTRRQMHHILRGIADGLLYLHTRKRKIIHRDLKSPNILLMKDFTVKIADFGSSKMKNRTLDQTMSCAFVGSPLWMAPEVIRAEPYNTKADVYGLAIIMWELCYGRLPYEGMNAVNIILHVSAGNRPPIGKEIPKEYSELIVACWDQNPENRPDVSQVLEKLKGIEGRYDRARARKRR